MYICPLIYHNSLYCIILLTCKTGLTNLSCGCLARCYLAHPNVPAVVPIILNLGSRFCKCFFLPFSGIAFFLSPTLSLTATYTIYFLQAVSLVDNAFSPLRWNRKAGECWNGEKFSPPARVCFQNWALAKSFHLETRLVLWKMLWPHFIIVALLLPLQNQQGAFSSWGEQGLLFIAVHGLLIVVASLVTEHGI